VLLLLLLLLLLLHQVVYPDKVPAIMQSPHPAVLSDGSMVNFSRVFPFGGTHLYRQDRVTLERKEVRDCHVRCIQQ
jgi:carlactone synthase/all-trans-10'-apo-beta-carotenal 13,14-cleaving dioxygenase